MKFACERCGKRFASVDRPAPGRAYRIRCRCGNVIRIRVPPREPAGSANPALEAPVITGGRPLDVEASVAFPGAPFHAGSPQPEPRSTTAPDPGSSPPTPAPFVDPATPFRRRTFPPVSDSEAFAAGFPEHPLATPVAALDGTAMPGFSAEQPPTDLPEFGVTANPPFPSSDIPWSRPEDILPGAPAASSPAPLEDDPFAVAAAREARLDLFDTTPPALPRGDTSPPIFIPAHEDEPTEERSDPRRDRLAAPRRRRALAIALGATIAASVGGALAWKLEAREAPRATTEPERETRAAAPGTAAQSAPAPVPESSAGEVTATPIPPATPRVPRPIPATAAATQALPAAAPSPAPVPSPAPASASGGGSEAERPRRLAATPSRSEPEPSPPQAPAPPARAEPSSAASASPERPRGNEQKAPERTSPRAPEGTEAAEAAEPEGGSGAGPARPKLAPRSPAPAPAAAPRKEASASRKAEPEGLDPSMLRSIIARNRSALDACVEQALQDPATASFAGRKVALLILVAPTGKAEAALEDGDVDGSPLGACLRRATAKMAFPQFRGDEVGARIVLELGTKNE